MLQLRTTSLFQFTGVCVKKMVMAAALLVAGTSAAQAVTYAFTGTEDGGAAVSGTLTIDTDLLTAANGAQAPATNYYFSTGDDTSTVAGGFLSVNFLSTGTQPTLFSSSPDYTYHQVMGDPGDGSFTLELDYEIANQDGTFSDSAFSLSRQDLFSTTDVAGVLLPNFTDGGTFYFSATGPDATSTGSIIFSALGAVPESSTWAMLVMGFGATGAALRRRRPAAIA